MLNAKRPLAIIKWVLNICWTGGQQRITNSSRGFDYTYLVINQTVGAFRFKENNTYPRYIRKKGFYWRHDRLQHFHL